MKTKEQPFTHAGRMLWFTPRTADEVKRILCELCGTEKRIRLFLGEPTTGEVWPEEYDVIGRIGCSMGPVKVPLLLRTSRSIVGGAILTHCVLGIDRAPGRPWYRHSRMTLGAWTVQPSKDKRVPWAVLKNGKAQAQFRTQAQAERYRLFIQGQQWTK